MKKLSLKNTELEERIIRIFNETYEDFIAKYGVKHKDYIKQMLENISDKVQKKEIYEGALASANVDMGVIYGKSDKLSAILKHELWHTFNESAFGTETSYATLPNRYKDFLDKTGFLRREYEIKMKEYQEKWKDEPERLKYLLVDYDEFVRNYDLGDSEIEKWTEWFNSRTNERDMQEHFVDLSDGFYMGGKSSSSFYDYYINLCDMISCIIPEDKLIDMHLNTEHHKTDYSFQQMISEFDDNSVDALDENERTQYGFPYLKILCETRTIDQKARQDDKATLDAIQSCMKTCFKAYYCKMNNMKEPNEDNVKAMYNEIKKMQKYMVWNVDTRKMEGLPYIQEMQRIQSKFKEICESLSIDNAEIQEMKETISFGEKNEFGKINNGEKIVNKIFAENNSEFEEKQYGEYTAKVNENGIKGNMYKAVKIIFGDKIFNQVFAQYNTNGNNELAKLYEMIENIDETNTDSIEQVYNYIYSIYQNKMDDVLKTDENSSTGFKRCYSDIIELQELALFRSIDGGYIKTFENIINLYRQKIDEFEEYIDYATQMGIKDDRERHGYDSSKFKIKLANDKKSELSKYIFDISERQENRAKCKLTRNKMKSSLQTIGLQEIGTVIQDIKTTNNKLVNEQNMDQVMQNKKDEQSVLE